MSHQRLKAYVNLIERLLSCPQGEEWILLRENQELVNQELVEVMEQIAHHFTIEGDIKAAKYLHNWAGKLHQILTERMPVDESTDKINAYVELIQALLSCPEGGQSAILAKHRDLIGPKLVKIMKEVGDRLEINGDRVTADYLHNLAADLNRTWLQEHKFEPTLKKELVPDPWLEEDSDAATSPTADRTDNIATINSDCNRKTKEIDKFGASSVRPQLTQLQVFADSLRQLVTILTTRQQPPNPLWYMDVLEKAIASNWILSTDEVEQLIGVKPHCEHNKTAYHRGNWVFTKAGKVGAQTGWKVSKEVDA